ncbi:MAG: OmpA family protein [Pedobacter sp.]|nr:OmpA family protein [Pedobacter sp.]
MRRLFSILIPVLLLFSSTATFAQKEYKAKAVYKAKADTEFKLFKFRSAAETYLHTDTTDVQVIQRLGECFKAVKDYGRAEYWLRKQATYPNQPDQFYLNFAEILANNGKYSEASEWYKKFAAKNPNDRRAKNLSLIDVKANYLKKDSLEWNLSYPTFNTNNDEFSPVYFKDGLIFTSNRSKKWGVTNTFGWNQTPFTDLYMTPDTTKLKYIKPADYFSDSLNVLIKKAKKQYLPISVNDNRVLGDVTYPKTLANIVLQRDTTPIILLDDQINTALHDGPATLTSDQQTMFFNRNQVKPSDKNSDIGIYRLNMFSANYVGGKWFNIKPFPYNSLEYSTAHPAFTPDGNTLYFVSDMPGGFGGKDLYYSLKDGDSWTKPMNMGPEINTEGDETFPYIAPNGDLYFASNGYTGLGGLDIFKVKLNNHKPDGEIKNLGYPVNSTKDDFGIIMDGKMTAGFFSSNRYGSDDIFRFDVKPILIQLEGLVQSVYNDAKIGVERAKVELTTGGITETVLTDNIGKYQFKLVPNAEYTLVAKKDGFTNIATGNVSTIGLKTSSTLRKDFMLLKPAATIPTVSECEKYAKIFKVDNIYYDLDKYNIRKDAVPVLDKIVALMKAYPKLTVIAASHTDSRASYEYNVRLSNNRSISAINYLVSKGIDRNRLSKEYFGERKTVNGCDDGVNCTEEQQQMNRRTEFYLFIDGKNITMDCKL